MKHEPILNGTICTVKLNNEEIRKQVSFRYINGVRADMLEVDLYVADGDSEWWHFDNLIKAKYPLGSVIEFSIYLDDKLKHKGSGVLMEQYTSFDVEKPVFRTLKIRI